MIDEKLQFYNLSGSLVYDPERAGDWAVDISWDTTWPKGYGVMTCTIRRRDTFANWAIKESYGVRVYDGSEIVYSGRIEAIARNFVGDDEFISIRAVGWYVTLQETHILKHWYDEKSTARLRWPSSLFHDEVQGTHVFVQSEKIYEIYSGTGDLQRVSGQGYRAIYEEPSGHSIKQIIFNYRIRSGETFRLRIYNQDQAAIEWTLTSAAAVQSATGQTVSMSAGITSSYVIWLYYNDTDLYDQSDYAIIDSLITIAHYHTSHSAYGSEAQTIGEYVEDILLIVNDVNATLSTDYSFVQDPGYVIQPFVVDTPRAAGEIIDQLAAYGDSSLRQWGISVWGETASDGKPLVIFEPQPALTDYEYILELDSHELSQLYYELDGVELENYIRIGYTSDAGNFTLYTPDDDPNLTDSNSIARDYQRDGYMDIGEADATRAAYVGQRRLNFHKNRKPKANFAVSNRIKKKNGGWQPANRIRAGERVYVPTIGRTFFISRTYYESESETCSISPELPRDQISLYLSQIKAELRT